MKPNRFRNCGVLAVVIGAAFAAAPAGAVDNLVANGSMNFPGVGAPTDWTFLNPSGEFWRSFGNMPSPDGGSYFGIQDLDSFAPRVNVGGITQLVDGLQIGQNYQLTFFSMSNHTSLSASAFQDWRVTFGGQTQTSRLTTAAAAGTWVQSSMTFTATAASQALTFMAEYLPGSYPEILNIDGVVLSATPVPEPPPGLLAGAGLLAIGWTVVRRRATRRPSAP